MFGRKTVVSECKSICKAAAENDGAKMPTGRQPPLTCVRDCARVKSSKNRARVKKTFRGCESTRRQQQRRPRRRSCGLAAMRKMQSSGSSVYGRSPIDIHAPISAQTFRGSRRLGSARKYCFRQSASTKMLLSVQKAAGSGSLTLSSSQTSRQCSTRLRTAAARKMPPIDSAAFAA